MMASKNNNKKSQSPPRSNNKTRKKEPEAKAPAEPTDRSGGITIVGIGASAGGLQALYSFFDTLAPDTGMAFVVVTHLHPEHESHMAELLQKHTSMPTTQVMQKLAVEPNHVYVIPPNRNMLLTDTHLETVDFTKPRGLHSPIDLFFRSLASEHRESIAIILSGGGTDGSVGIKAIKESGGVIMVQHPSDAEYDSMPRAAINTGLADVILPVNQLAEKLMQYVQHRPQLPHDVGQLTEQEAETLQRILAQVHARTGQDFNQYKRSTILRRIERRMQLNGFPTLEGYLHFLRHTPNEAQSIFNDILIGVTNFFRDHDSWTALDQHVIQALFENKEDGDEIRVWSIGCATGEEAYGLAMLLFEAASKFDVQLSFQIFASDLDEKSIARAREGVYPTAIEADVSPERLERFFVREGEYYRVKHEIRDRILFTNHNVLRDPPFSRQDLVTCRNVLIYLQREVQEKVFKIFHYALNPGGHLFLGGSESAEHMPDLFQVVDKNHRIFQAKAWQGGRPHIPSLPLTLRRRRADTVEPPAHPRPGRYPHEPATFEEHHERALETYGPPSLIINDSHMILHVSETAGRYLVQPRGPITGDVLKLVRPELQMELRTAIFQAFEKDRAIVSGPVYVQFNGHPHRVILSVRPRSGARAGSRSLEKQALILFLEHELDESREWAGRDPDQTVDHGEQNTLVARLQAEVQHLREQLQVTIEEYDSSNEEMKAANEELQSINEEYRSATEELETSKEELQSVNEELHTVNNDMKNRLEEISRAHQELENLMNASEVGSLFLDRELRIQRFTAGVREIINIMPTDRGRPIGHLTHRLVYNNFMRDAEQVLRQLVPLEQEVQTDKDDCYLLRFRPFRTVQDRIEGVVITFINITELKESKERLLHVNQTLEERVFERTRELDAATRRISQTRDLFYAIFNTNPIPTALTRMQDNVFINVNAEFLSYFGLELEQIIGHPAHEFGLDLGLGRNQQARDHFTSRLKKQGRIGNHEVRLQHPSGETRNVLASVQYLKIDNQDALITAFVDITARVRAEKQIRSLAYELTQAEQHERQRISQVLHDDLQQRIFAVKVQTSILDEAYRRGNLQSAQVDFDQLEKSLDESIAITRNLSIDISPAVLQGEGLTEALGWLAAQMHEQYGLQVDIQAHDVPTQFEDTLRILLFHAVREALFNIVKHADTLQAAIVIEESDGHVQITVSDEGCGFESEQITDQENAAGGLMRLRHRLNLMGCNLQVQSQPGKGTRVTMAIQPNQGNN
jgi:two-component system, chemotaxis family, CheB/CheR fusion protein